MENILGTLKPSIEVVRGRYERDEFYLKADGSLYTGMELVSHPRSLEAWREIAPDLSDMFGALSKTGMRAWSQSRAGLHIHVGRDNFTNSHLMRFLMLFARNEHMWVDTANRRSSYANFQPIQSGNAMRAKDSRYGSHSDAVNVSANNGATVEVHIFRPSLAINRVIGSIELVHASVEYTRSMTSHDAVNGGLAFSAFAEFVHDNNYPMAQAILNRQRFTLENGSTPCA